MVPVAGGVFSYAAVWIYLANRAAGEIYSYLTAVGAVALLALRPPVAVLLQVLCVPAVWALLRALRLTGYRLIVVLTMFLFTGFFVYNSVFVWPKLLAASMTLTAFALLFFGRPARSMWALAGVAAGAGMVAHAGVAFTLLPMGLLLLRRRYRPSWQHLGLTAAGGALLQAPWMAYRKIIDPPGDQLLKWHLAGVWQPAFGPDQRSLTELAGARFTPQCAARWPLPGVTGAVPDGARTRVW
ncbi:hypothetical protein [Dactylosporangium sp. CA-092794]|uniref:hypothetical protein n=1 Tax=Dactylosporangium sp. CA-092794 TaxID=3239929 RepID=UPI003D908C16